MRKVEEVCPFCGAGPVTLLDDVSRVHGCRCGRYWRDKEGVTEELRRLTRSEASVKMTMRNKQYVEEAELLSKIDIFKDIPLFTVEDLQIPRQGLLGQMRDGELMVFLTPDEEIIYALIDDKPDH